MSCCKCEFFPALFAPWHRPKGTENTYSYINILAKTLCAVHTTEFRPVVVVRLLHTTLCTFAYTILGRVESTLKKKLQLEKHGRKMP